MSWNPRRVPFGVERQAAGAYNDSRNDAPDSADARGRRMSLNRRAATYAALARRWTAMLFGRSYWHVPQGPGTQFAPGELRGYFNDLTAKTEWKGPVDPRGLPLVRPQGGAEVVFPITVFQKALGHWDRWLADGRRDNGHRDAFLTAARWALAVQDDRGGWVSWPLLGMRLPSPYSAMAQGQGLSLLARAYAATNDPACLRAAERALPLLLAPIAEGGTARHTPEGLVLEEYPRTEPDSVLNGWIFALFGLHDLGLVQPTPAQADALASTLGALARRLPAYNAGFWSYYDARGALASPFYHHLHVSQLTVLEKAFPAHAAAFAAARTAFERQARSAACRYRAMARKAWQKLARLEDDIVQ